MRNTENKYTIGELKKNMRVKVSQLNCILDVPMILVDTKVIADGGDLEGTLVYFGKAETEEYEGWFRQTKPITPIYFNSTELGDDVVYDE
ncbi:MAG: hypothetical protein NC400_02760 [Clostridium sp.]|nr:hypothetical protein [Clostridium sp.]